MRFHRIAVDLTAACIRECSALYFGATDMDQRSKSTMQLIYGILLVLVGIGVLFKIPVEVPRIAQIEQFAYAKGFIYFCLYLIAFAIIFGGGKKIYEYLKTPVDR